MNTGAGQSNFVIKGGQRRSIPPLSLTDEHGHGASSKDLEERGRILD
jgi:hypothetical protein